MPGYPLTVGGTTYDVDFPYEAYDCQLAMMEKVIESLTGQRNALLESPTGACKRNETYTRRRSQRWRLHHHIFFSPFFFPPLRARGADIQKHTSKRSPQTIPIVLTHVVAFPPFCVCGVVSRVTRRYGKDAVLTLRGAGMA